MHYLNDVENPYDTEEETLVICSGEMTEQVTFTWTHAFSIDPHILFKLGHPSYRRIKEDCSLQPSSTDCCTIYWFRYWTI